MGGKASLSNLVITALYVIFWSVFSTISRKYEPLIKISLVVSAASFISSTAGLIARGFGIGGFITGIIGLFLLFHSTDYGFYGMDRTLCGCNSIVTYVADLYLGIQA